MKKLIQVCAMLSLVIVFSVVAAKAQAFSKHYSAEIPFDFSIGQKSYQAGHYVIKISKLSLDSVSLVLEDKNRNILQTMFVRGNGDVTRNEEKLIFTRTGDQRVLSQMITQESQFVIPATGNQKRMLKAKGRPETKPEVVSIASN